MLLKKKIHLSITQHLHAQSFVFNVRFHIFSLHSWVNKGVISADCLASVYSKIPHSFATSVEAPLPRNVPPPPLHIPSDMHCVVQDNIHTPRRATEIQRGGGVQISEGVGGGLLNRPLKFLTEGLRVAKIIVFIDDLLFAVRCTFFIACMIVYVTRLSSAHE